MLEPGKRLRLGVGLRGPLLIDPRAGGEAERSPESGAAGGRVARRLLHPPPARDRTIFQRDERGKITGFVERREAWDIAWTRIATQ